MKLSIVWVTIQGTKELFSLEKRVKVQVEGIHLSVLQGARLCQDHGVLHNFMFMVRPDQPQGSMYCQYLL
jgi:hypothetical protein